MKFICNVKYLKLSFVDHAAYQEVKILQTLCLDADRRQDLRSERGKEGGTDTQHCQRLRVEVVDKQKFRHVGILKIKSEYAKKIQELVIVKV